MNYRLIYLFLREKYVFLSPIYVFHPKKYVFPSLLQPQMPKREENQISARIGALTRTPNPRLDSVVRPSSETCQMRKH